MKLLVSDVHTELLGKVCRLSELGVEIGKEYENLFGVCSNIGYLERIYQYCNGGLGVVILLMFIDEAPVKIHGLIFFCLKEIGKDASGDYHWFTLDQLIICDSNI